MANGKTHIIAGGIAGLSIALLDQGEKSEFAHHPIIAATVGAFSGKLPDILEPATSPHHRQFCHSLVVLGSIVYCLKEAYDWRPEDTGGKFLRGMALTIGGGYISHLLLDSTTPMGLPVVGKV